MKARLLQLALSFTLTAIVAVSLARGTTPMHLDVGLTLVDQITAAQAQGIYTDVDGTTPLNRYGGSWKSANDPSFIRLLDVEAGTRPANNTTCAPLVTHLLLTTYNWSWSNYSYSYVDAGKNVTIKTASPKPEHYILFIKNRVGFAAQITHFAQLQPGDIMAIAPTAHASGHVTVVVHVDLASARPYPSDLPAADPALAGSTLYAVTVLDSSSGVHTDDTRLVNVDGVITQIPGIGTGTMGLLVAANGDILGHTWSLPTSDYDTHPAAWLNGLHDRLRLQSDREIVFGRLPVLPSVINLP